MAKIKISMTIDDQVYDSFKKFCADNGMKISTKVEVLMKNAVKDTSLKGFIKD
ncbi:MAG: hypothetical protein ABIB43_00795 [archaeon]